MEYYVIRVTNGKDTKLLGPYYSRVEAVKRHGALGIPHTYPWCVERLYNVWTDWRRPEGVCPVETVGIPHYHDQAMLDAVQPVDGPDDKEPA